MHRNQELSMMRCPTCSQPIKSDLMRVHQQSCQTQRNIINIRPPLNMNNNNRNSQNRSQDSRVHNIIQRNVRMTNQSPQPRSQQDEAYRLCEYCNEKYPTIVFKEHFEVCEARKFVLQLQQQEGNPSTRQNNRERTFLDELPADIKEQIVSLRPGSHIEQQTILRDGCVRTTQIKIFPNGAALLQIKYERQNVSRRNVERCRLEELPQDLRERLIDVSVGSQVEIQSQLDDGTIRTAQIVVDNNGSRKIKIIYQFRPNRRQNHDQNQGLVVILNDRQRPQQRIQQQFGVGILQGLISFLQGAMHTNEHQHQHQPVDMEEINEIKFQPSRELAEENKKCSICITEYESGDNLKLLSCTHRFHSECLTRWFQQSDVCPICRKKVRD